MWIIFLAELSALIAGAAYAKPKYAPWFRQEFGGGDNKLWIWSAPLGLWLSDRLRWSERWPEMGSRIHQLMLGLHGPRRALVFTRSFAASIIVGIAAIFCLFTLLGALAEGNAEMLAYGAGVALFFPFVRFKQISDQLKQKRRRMLLELPELLNELILLVNAGETLQQALIRTVEAKPPGSGPLHTELLQATYALKMNASFVKTMEDFSKRCALQEVSMFTTTLLLNHKRGGEELVLSLRELSIILWDKRKALARTLGEEASSKLVFPMVLIFFIVMVIVASPALMMMS